MSKTNSLTESVIKYLTCKGFFAWRQNNGAVYDPQKGIFRKNSSFRGVGDVLAIDPNGRFWAVEIKVGKDKMSVYQHSFKREVEKRGGVYLEVKTIDDLIKIVDIELPMVVISKPKIHDQGYLNSLQGFWNQNIESI